jgi:hypothetical protein
VPLNRGRDRPRPRAPKVEEQLRDAQEALALLDGRIELLTHERGEYVRDHKDELFSLLNAQHRAASNTVSRLARETLAALLEMYRAEDEARELRRTHPEPQEINMGDPAPVTTILHAPTLGQMQGQRRGDIEGVLRLLQSYGEATVVGEVAHEEQPAAVHEGGA